MERVLNINCGKITSLCGCFLFDGVEPTRAAEMLKTCAESGQGIALYKFSKGEEILSFEEGGECLGFVLSGCISVIKKHDAQVLLNTVCAGGVFGAAALFAKGNHLGTSCVAKTAGEVLFLDRGLVSKLISSDSNIALNYIAFLSQKICFLNRKISAFTAPSAEDKLFEYLLQLSGAGGESKVVLPMSLNKLSDWLCVGRASLYRAFDSLESKGRIIKDGRNIIILDFTPTE